MSWRPVGRPHYGVHIERLIGTLMGRIHLLPGTTKSNPLSRGVYQAEKAAQMTLSELERWVTLEICGRYHVGVHASLRRAPLHARQDWFAGRGEHPVIAGDAGRLRLSFMPIIYRKLSRQGIAFNGIHTGTTSCQTPRSWANESCCDTTRDISRLFALE
jgi:putative transposase